MPADNETLTIARRYFTDIWNEQNFEAVQEVFGPTYTYIMPNGDRRELPSGAAPDTVGRWHAGFESLRYDIKQEAVANDGSALFFTTISGVHTGTFQWLHLGPWEPTGRSMSLYQTFAFGVSEGRIATMASVWDQAHLIEQLGVDADHAANPKYH